MYSTETYICKRCIHPCVSEYTTIRVSKSAHSVAKMAKDDDETWNDFIKRCIDNQPEEEVEIVVDGEGVASSVARELDYEALAEKVADHLERRLV